MRTRAPAHIQGAQHQLVKDAAWVSGARGPRTPARPCFGRLRPSREGGGCGGRAGGRRRVARGSCGRAPAATPRTPPSAAPPAAWSPAFQESTSGTGKGAAQSSRRTPHLSPPETGVRREGVSALSCRRSRWPVASGRPRGARWCHPGAFRSTDAEASPPEVLGQQACVRALGPVF